MSLITQLTYILPHRLLSSMARRLAYSQNPAIKQRLIDTRNALRDIRERFFFRRLRLLLKKAYIMESPSRYARTAFCACRRLCASGKTRDRGPS